MDDLYLKDELPLQQNAEYRRVTFFLIGNFRVNNKVSQVTLQIFMKRTQRTPQPGVWLCGLKLNPQHSAS